MALRDCVQKSLIAAPLCLALAGPADAADIEDAMYFYDAGHYVLALDRFRAAAAGGDARAQEILGFMYALGSEVYPGVPRDSRSAAYWFDIAARSGRPVSRYMACAMRRGAMGARLPHPHCFDWVVETGRPGPR